MKKVPSIEVKKRSCELTSVFEAFSPHRLEGKVERIWITEIATDGVHLVGHTKGYIQVLIIAQDSMLGTSANVKITSVGRWSVFGEVIEGSIAAKEVLKQNPAEAQEEYRQNHAEEATCSTNSCGSCACSGAESTSQQCGSHREDPSDAPTDCGDATCQEAAQSTLVRRNVEGTMKTRESDTGKPVVRDQQVNLVNRSVLNIDRILWVGLAVSFATTLALFVLLSYKIFWSSY